MCSGWQMRAFSPWSPAPTSTRPQSWWRSVLLTSSFIQTMKFRIRKFFVGSILIWTSTKLCFEWNPQKLLAVTWWTEEGKIFGLENRKKAAKLFWCWRNLRFTSSSIQRMKFRRGKFCFVSILTCEHPASFVSNKIGRNSGWDMAGKIFG